MRLWHEEGRVRGRASKKGMKRTEGEEEKQENRDAPDDTNTPDTDDVALLDSSVLNLVVGGGAV